MVVTHALAENERQKISWFKRFSAKLQTKLRTDTTMANTVSNYLAMIVMLHQTSGLTVNNTFIKITTKTS